MTGFLEIFRNSPESGNCTYVPRKVRPAQDFSIVSAAVPSRIESEGIASALVFVLTLVHYNISCAAAAVQANHLTFVIISYYEFRILQNSADFKIFS